MLWVIFALLTGVAVFSILWPLAKTPRKLGPAELDIAFYKAQLGEIDRDVERGQLAAGDAEAVKAEAARRLMAVSDRRSEVPVITSHWPVRIAACAALIFIPALTLALYSQVGHPDWPDQPLEARLKASPEQMDLATAIAKVEAHLVQFPQDGRGYEVLAPAYLRMGRGDDAVRAAEAALRLLGETSERRATYGEALVYAAGGVVTADARKAFEIAVSGEPSLPKAQFYLGLAAEQDGDKTRALDLWRKLLAESPEDAPWTEVLRAKIAALSGDGAPSPGAIAALPEAERTAAIRSMVDSLAARLAQNGQDVEGWLRLVRAYKVLDEFDKARSALGAARRNLTKDPDAMARLDALARELGLGG
jgi:cytochrome c-type biogenesis protein CcmH